MAPTIASTVVDRPAAEVFSYTPDPTHFHEWQQGLIDGHLEPAGPAQVGSKCVTTRRIGGANRAVTSVLTHIDAPRAWGVRGIDGPVRATVDVTVEPLTETSSRLPSRSTSTGTASANCSSRSSSAARPKRKCQPTSKP